MTFEKKRASARRLITPLLWVLVAIAGLLVVNLRQIGWFDPHDPALDKGITLGGTVLFTAAGVVATRRFAAYVNERFRRRGLGPAGSVLSVVIAAVGYVVVGLSALNMVAIPLQQLLVGGAVTGVLVGIAAQQTLGNVFAGMVILLVRPFRVGDTIEVRSGALNGPFTGRVSTLGLTYVTLSTENGTLLLPNSGVLAAGVTVGLRD